MSLDPNSLFHPRERKNGKEDFGRGSRPIIRIIDPWSISKTSRFLNADERAQLTSIALPVRFRKGAEIYRQAHQADAVFNISSGVVKAYTTAAGGEHITAFLFPGDLFGLSDEGKYVSSTKAITPVTGYKFPVTALRDRLPKDAHLEFHVICKLCQELRQAQRHAFVLSHRRASSKLAMFLQLLEELQAARGEPTNDLYLPMSRSDIGDYLGMSLEAVSRTFRSLTAANVIKSRDRRYVRVIDRKALENAAGDLNIPLKATSQNHDGDLQGPIEVT
jgi:CRP/FNR family transcriptional regulator